MALCNYNLTCKSRSKDMVSYILSFVVITGYPSLGGLTLLSALFLVYMMYSLHHNEALFSHIELFYPTELTEVLFL